MRGVGCGSTTPQSDLSYDVFQLFDSLLLLRVHIGCVRDHRFPPVGLLDVVLPPQLLYHQGDFLMAEAFEIFGDDQFHLFVFELGDSLDKQHAKHLLLRALLSGVDDTWTRPFGIVDWDGMWVVDKFGFQFEKEVEGNSTEPAGEIALAFVGAETVPVVSLAFQGKVET